MDSHENYKAEKIGRIILLDNVMDNAMYMLAMFDEENRAKVLELLSPKARKEVQMRIDYVNYKNLTP